jgi:hypothetical protein
VYSAACAGPAADMTDASIAMAIAALAKNPDFIVSPIALRAS